MTECQRKKLAIVKQQGKTQRKRFSAIAHNCSGTFQKINGLNYKLGTKTDACELSAMHLTQADLLSFTTTNLQGNRTLHMEDMLRNLELILVEHTMVLSLLTGNWK